MQRYAPVDEKVGDHGRALIGFHDGLSNLNPDDPGDQTLVFVDPAAVTSYPANPPAVATPGQPGYGATADPTTPTFPTDLRQPPTAEPGWTAGGSYMFIRASVLDTNRWDTQTLGTQEAAVGRFKSSGSFQPNRHLRQPTQPTHLRHRPRLGHRATDVSLPTRQPQISTDRPAATRPTPRVPPARSQCRRDALAGSRAHHVLAQSEHSKRIRHRRLAQQPPVPPPRRRRRPAPSIRNRNPCGRLLLRSTPIRSKRPHHLAATCTTVPTLRPKLTLQLSSQSLTRNVLPDGA